MATTAIWDVTDRLKRVLDYARNPDKTAQDRRTRQLAAGAWLCDGRCENGKATLRKWRQLRSVYRI
ncbi:hypothetical protein [Paenibacillus sp. 32O-W]|uniref:hypothetical protein n=1 Tax=Paenibacillus sp. 32O-W TaxID=1695218 RepID=UPI0021B54089|nr:hypothetical protein [Paenibacillus sp. 32O-W]